MALCAPGDAVCVSGGYDASVRVWDARASGFRAMQTLNAREVGCRSVIARDERECRGTRRRDAGRRRVRDGAARVVDLRRGLCHVDRLDAPVTSVSHSRDEQCLAVSCLTSRVALLDCSSATRSPPIEDTSPSARNRVSAHQHRRPRPRRIGGRPRALLGFSLRLRRRRPSRARRDHRRVRVRFRARGRRRHAHGDVRHGRSRALLDRFLGRRHRRDVAVVHPSSHGPTHTRITSRLPRAITATRVRESRREPPRALRNSKRHPQASRTVSTSCVHHSSTRRLGWRRSFDRSRSRITAIDIFSPTRASTRRSTRSPRARSSDASASSRAQIVGSGSRWRARSSREGPPCTACVEITNEG